ncbi:putative metal-dependent HD superfamily phosphohydrolase [Nocardioides zeae]|uniref:Metal-dependent HD superfamily phosphohydrolase n=1 Tax=Nocardioides zeae TaxID=1457234 RepID=A0ACC6IK70_9ACTN|nr:hypothetical protein [Nocardioides zeae]MDR6173724.1 putative metal-dependent HD superfamily phosphohydrolase [Nocardioides zeae]MDR6211127.1 putative metal-dependent HD superfamily phosphohydrolase [Nocardioides zeae]
MRVPDLPWPLPRRSDLRDELVAAYGTGRGYHDLRHLTEVLERLDELGWGHDMEVVLAAWFHDAVYDGGADLEERSALLALARLAGEDVDVDEVVRLVRLTADHRPAADDRRGQALVDADLAILAAPPQRYDEYRRAVRTEYAHVPDPDFRTGRRAVLQDLAGRERLFHTAQGHDRWDTAARENLAREIAELSD